ncbi:MAG: BatD family protein [Sulfurimonas sp.]|nr:BatD family protein [Sulfurimonas sp.]
MFYKISILFFLLVFSSYLNATQTINPPRGYSLEARLKETNILLGETTQLTLIYRYTDVEDYEIKEPQFSGIVIKELDSKDFKDKNGSFREEINYSLTPQREGNFTLNDLQVISQIIDTKYKNFNNRSKYTKEFSLKANTLTLEVIKLPNNITAIGEYQLKASVDKQYAKEAEVVTLTLSLYGDGNIQNLDALEPKIENATLNLLYTTRSKGQCIYLQRYMR